MIFTPVTGTNTDEAISILARAFHDDPIIEWTCNNPSSLDLLCEITLQPFIPHQLSYLDPQGRGTRFTLPQ